ncbi:RCC1 domain-containing protein 1 [Condylostylus longicornis]|uniref:RCC1 domain-containing protein 1 n=1 Tax=Condylostylus longicornis TaxID=2530218 RepID=UPI00244E5AEE|nr:RCC1 domain-containing protein 1 [Condylostylus longicornis]
MSLKFCGFNGFQQFPGCTTNKTTEPTVFEIPHMQGNKNVLINCLWSFNIFACDKILLICGFIDGNSKQVTKIELEDDIKQICSNEKICLILLKSEKMLKFDLMKKSLNEVNFRITNPGKKRSIFGEQICKLDTVTHLACCISAFIAITSNGSVYCLPDKIYQFPSHMKIKYLVSGLEHFLLLNSNGDVYSWGNGSRGQLGHVELDNVDCPTIVDALAGIKIIYISAGGWHSGAISAFGDLYIWGSNVHGQLGICCNKTSVLNPEKNISRNPTLYPLPKIVDIDCNCCKDKNVNEINDCCAVSIKCGVRHTIVQMSCGIIYGSGWNAYNQLGIIKETENNEDIVDVFIPIENINVSVVAEYVCGPWCTVFKLKEEM